MFRKGVRNTAVAFFPDGRRTVQRKHNVLEPERRGSGCRELGPRKVWVACD